MTTVEILSKFTIGEATLEETNASLKESGSSLVVNRDGRMGNALLDCGVGNLEFTMVEDGKLVYACAVPHQDEVYYKGKLWHVDDDQKTLIEI